MILTASMDELRQQNYAMWRRIEAAYWQARFGWAVAVHGEADWNLYEQSVAL